MLTSFASTESAARHALITEALEGVTAIVIRTIYDYLPTKEWVLSLKEKDLTQIGGGAHATVFKVKDTPYAIKRYRGSSDLSEYQKLMKLAQCPNVCEVYDCFEDNVHFGVERPLCILMRFYPDTLLHRIEEGKRKGSLTGQGHLADEKQILTYLFQLAEGFTRIHEEGVTHRDVKPDNLFIDEEGNLVIGDWGESGESEGMKYLESLRGTRGYVAPEVFEGKYKQSADMWSVGCVALDLATLSLTTPELKVAKRLEQIRANFPKLQKVLAGLLEANPKLRMTALQLRDVLRERKFEAQETHAAKSKRNSTPAPLGNSSITFQKACPMRLNCWRPLIVLILFTILWIIPDRS